MAQETKAESKSTSKTIVLTGHGGYDMLRIEENPRPHIERDEVLVNIKASGINFAELMCRMGLYDRAPPLPAVLGLEGAGVVVQVGQDVKGFKEGDRVLCLRKFGLWSEYVNVKADFCFHMPEKMTFEEAAAIPVTYLTAHVILFHFGNLRKGQSVLVHMAAGGVGTAATQLCKTVPNVTIFGTASTAKHALIKDNGVTYPIDYRTQDYVAEIHKISPGGVDIVMDPLAGEDSVKGYNLLKPLGKIIHFGGANFVTGPKKGYLQIIKTWWNTKNVNPLRLMSENKAVCGVHLGYMFNHPEPLKEIMVEVLELYKQGHIKPIIDTVWAFEDVAKAMARMHERKNIGKVIISTERQPETDPDPK